MSQMTSASFALFKSREIWIGAPLADRDRTSNAFVVTVIDATTLVGQ
jgi:hypothetical protein